MTDLQLQGVVLVDEEVLHERGLAVADRLTVERVLLGGPAVDLDVLVRVVEQDVGVGLGDGERADLLLGGPAGRDGGHGSRVEHDLHGGHVGDRRVHRRADRGDLAGLAVDQVQHDVDVVDHQVHHHRVVLHARHERAQAPRLDQDGPLHDLAQLLHCAVEPLDVTDVEHPVLLARDPEQLLGLLERGGHGFFDQHVRARLEQIARHREVLLGGHRHRGEVDEAGELAVVAEGARPVGGGHALGPLEVDVHHPDQLHVPDLGEGENVVLAHVAGPHHRPAKLGLAVLAHEISSGSASARARAPASAAGTMPRLDCSTNSTRRATSG
jgi:hypothetical protein